MRLIIVRRELRNSISSESFLASSLMSQTLEKPAALTSIGNINKIYRKNLAYIIVPIIAYLTVADLK